MLTPEQRQAYWEDGFIFPVDVASPEEVNQWYTELVAMREQHEEAWVAGEVGTLKQWLAPIAERRSIIEQIGSLLGPKVQVQNVDVFVKKPMSGWFWPWSRRSAPTIRPHVDTHFPPPEPDRRITIWIPLAKAKPSHGGLVYFARSHRDLPDELPLRPEMVSISDEVFQTLSKPTPVRLVPGQMSVHHGRMVHSSGGNWGRKPRIALAIRYQGLGEPLSPNLPTPADIQMAERDFPVSWRNC